MSQGKGGLLGVLGLQRGKVQVQRGRKSPAQRLNELKPLIMQVEGIANVDKDNGDITGLRITVRNAHKLSTVTGKGEEALQLLDDFQRDAPGIITAFESGVRKRVTDNAEIKEIGDVVEGDGAIEKAAQLYVAAKGFVDQGKFTEAFEPSVQLQEQAPGLIAGFKQDVNTRRQRLKKSLEGTAKLGRPEASEVLGRAQSMLDVVMQAPPTEAYGLLSELEPLARQAFRLASGIGPAEESLKSLPRLNVKALVDESVAQTLAGQFGASAQVFNSRLDGILERSSKELKSDKRFAREVITPTRTLLDSLDVNKLKDDPARREARKELQARQVKLTEERSRLEERLKKKDTPLDRQQQEIVNEFMQQVGLLILKLDNVKELEEGKKEELKTAKRRQLQENGTVDNFKKLVEAMGQDGGAVDLEERAKALAKQLGGLDDVTRDILLEAELSLDGIIPVLYEVGTTELDHVVSSLVKGHAQDHDFMGPLCDRLVEEEVRGQVSMGNCLRGNSLTTKMAKAYNVATEEGQQYLNTSLSETFQTLRTLPLGEDQPWGNLEVDPSKRTGPVPQEVIDKHCELMRNTLSEITSVKPPPEVSKVCATIYEESLQKLKEEGVENPEEKALIYVGGQIALRLLVPKLLTDPEEVGQRTPAQTRVATLQGKLLQNISNVASDSKEEFMAPFTGLVVDSDGEPSEEVIALQEYFKQIVYEGKKEKGELVLPPVSLEQAQQLSTNCGHLLREAPVKMRSLAQTLGKGETRGTGARIANLINRLADEMPLALADTLEQLVTAAEQTDMDALMQLKGQARKDAKACLAYLKTNGHYFNSFESYPREKVAIAGPLKAELDTVMESLK